MAKEIGAAYLECSALKKIGLDAIFSTLMEEALRVPANYKKKTKPGCVVM